MIKQYQEQVNKIAKALGCNIVVGDFRSTAMMYVEAKPPYVEVPHITDQISYLITLHELGHVYCGHTQGRPPYNDEKFYFENGVLRSEAEAWSFAMAMCLDELQPESRRFMWNVCMGSYYIAAVNLNGQSYRLFNGNRHHVEFIFDKPDKYFTSVVKRMQGNLTDFTIEYKE